MSCSLILAQPSFSRNMFQNRKEQETWRDQSRDQLYLMSEITNHWLPIIDAVVSSERTQSIDLGGKRRHPPPTSPKTTRAFERCRRHFTSSSHEVV